MSCSTFDLENRENFFSYLLKPSFSPATSRIQWSLQQYPLQTLPRQRFWQLYRASSYQFLSPCDCCCSFSMTIFDISATERVADGQTVLYFAHVPVEGQKSYVLLGLTYLEPFFKLSSSWALLGHRWFEKTDGTSEYFFKLGSWGGQTYCRPVVSQRSWAFEVDPP